MPTKFRITTGSDFGTYLANTHLRQTMHKVQTNLKSAKPRQSEYRGGSIKNEINFEVPGDPMDKEAVLEWVLDVMRVNYIGPPVLIVLDMLDDKYEVVDDPDSLA